MVCVVCDNLKGIGCWANLIAQRIDLLKPVLIQANPIQSVVQLDNTRRKSRDKNLGSKQTKQYLAIENFDFERGLEFSKRKIYCVGICMNVRCFYSNYFRLITLELYKQNRDHVLTHSYRANTTDTQINNPNKVYCAKRVFEIVSKYYLARWRY